ncbi:MAG: hypothetical protein QNK05_25265, partial [Myxococcota bacterium]|nr:hypothetical protein [Myxococcota bacterium]
MAALLSYGVYVPPTRLNLAQIGGRPPRDGGPEKAVAWNDEDSVTLAVSAGVSCLAGFDRESVDGVLFTTTTQPFQEKQGAALIARALDLPRSVRTADLTGSLRAGLGALRAAADSVAAGSARRVLVVVSDCRMGAPGSAQERSFGDAAAAFLVGEGPGIATLGESFSVSDEIVDVWRTAGDPFVHAWEERFIVQEGYVPRSVEAVRGLLEKTGTAIGDFHKIALYAPDARSHGTVARALGIDGDRLQDPLLASVGNSGAAAAPLFPTLASSGSCRRSPSMPSARATVPWLRASG